MPEGPVLAAVLAVLSGASFGVVTHVQRKGLDTNDPRTAVKINMAAVVGIGVFLGLAGSWLTAARHMRRIEPR